jgi:hypothetical protein
VSTRHRISAFAICAAVAVFGLTDASARGFGDAHRGGSFARVGQTFHPQTFHPMLRQTTPMLRETSRPPARLAKICDDNPRLCRGNTKPPHVPPTAPPNYPPSNVGQGSFGQGVSSNQGANQGSGSTTVFTLPPALLKDDAVLAQYRDNAKLQAALAQFQADLGCYAEETQRLQNKIQQEVQQIENPNCDTACIASAGQLIQQMQAVLQSLSNAVAEWEYIQQSLVEPVAYGLTPANIQSAINQLATAETLMFAIPGNPVPYVSYTPPPSCNAGVWDLETQ